MPLDTWDEKLFVLLWVARFRRAPPLGSLLPSWESYPLIREMPSERRRFDDTGEAFGRTGQHLRQLRDRQKQNVCHKGKGRATRTRL